MESVGNNSTAPDVSSNLSSVVALADTDWFADVAKRILDHHVALGLANQNAYRRPVMFASQLRIDSGNVEVHSARKLGFEFDDLQVDDDVTVQPDMVKQ